MTYHAIPSLLSKQPLSPLSLFSLMLLALVWAQAACVRITPVNVGQKTSLERQLVGEFEPLSQEEMLLTSVRASTDLAHGSFADLQQRAIAAKQRQLFFLDDLVDLEAAGCIGEGRNGHIVARPCKKNKDTENIQIVQRIKQENSDRDAIIDWALAADPVLTVAHRSQLVEIYTKLLQQRASTGTWTQHADGSWQKKREQKNNDANNKTTP